jgi:phospholipid transport system substrate-binding protein
MMRSTTKQAQMLISFISLLLASTWSFAYNTPALTANDPAYVIKTALDKITVFSSKSDKINPVKLRGFIENQVIPHFDFNNMSHWITGHYADNMTAKDKSDFQRTLRETFLSSLSKHLGSFDPKNTKVRFFPARYRGPDEVFVSTNILRPDTLPVRLDFRMRRDEKDWKIIDVKANGSSAVLYYRQHFIAQLRQYRRQYQRSYSRAY